MSGLEVVEVLWPLHEALAAARFGISCYSNIEAWVRRFQARPAYGAALTRAGAYSFAS